MGGAGSVVFIDLSYIYLGVCFLTILFTLYIYMLCPFISVGYILQILFKRKSFSTFIGKRESSLKRKMTSEVGNLEDAP